MGFPLGGGGGTLEISGLGCAAGTLEPLTYTRATILDKINGKPRPPLPPKSRMEKWPVFALRAASSLIWGGWLTRPQSSLLRRDGGLLFHFILFKIAILDKINGKPRPPSPPPNQGWKNGAFLPLARLHP